MKANTQITVEGDINNPDIIHFKIDIEMEKTFLYHIFTTFGIIKPIEQKRIE